MREVNLLTPVMTSRDDFARAHVPQKRSYIHGDSLAQLAPEPSEASDTGSLVIDMPLEGIKEYLAPLLDLDEIATDEALVAHLLASSRASGPSTCIPAASGTLQLEMCLRSSAVFERFDEETRSRVIDRLQSMPASSKGPKRDAFTQANELLLHERLRDLDPSIPEDKEAARWLTARVNLARCPLKKRHAKQYEKEGRVLYRRLRGATPRAIAAELEVTKTFINNTLGVLNKKARYLLADS
jgi:hypothetical protein